MVKNPPANAGDPRDAGSISGSERSHWRRKWQPTPVSLPRKSYEQRSPAGHTHMGSQRDMTEGTHTFFFFSFQITFAFFLGVASMGSSMNCQK